MTSSQAIKELRKYADPDKAKSLQRFFKTKKGEYGEGDKFLGVVVPDIRRVARQYQNLDLSETEKLITSPYHEIRLCGLLILIGKENISRFYLDHAKFINNWDLVDLTAPHVPIEKLVLYRLVRSKNLWERRIAIISTFRYIRQSQFQDTINLAEILLADHHDLIHKAVGWALREVGKKDGRVLEQFLAKHARQMPRTMLRYAIEKLPEVKRREYLKK